MLTLLMAAQLLAGVGTVALLLSVFYGAESKPDKRIPDILFSIDVANPVSILRRRLKAWSYLFNGPRIIREGYEKSGGKPYEVFDPDTRYVFVSDPDQIQEVNKAPDTVLSLHAASKQMLQPQYTMQGYSWHDQRNVSGVSYSKALRTLLTNHTPSVIPQLQTKIKASFAQHIEHQPKANGTRNVPFYHMIHETTALVNSTAFFGPELSANKEFMHSALHYIEETLITAESMRLFPKFMLKPVSWFLSKRMHTSSVLYDALVPVVDQRFREKELKAAGHDVPAHQDCIQWMMDSSTKQNPWPADKIIGHLMAIWFGSVHALSTVATFATYDLLLHPEYIDPLRKELASDAYAQFEKTGQGLPLLDSFFKESARVNAGETMSTRRRAIQPFSLSDGTSIATGDWVCTPVQQLNTEAAFVPSPTEFRGFRFAEQEAFDLLNKDHISSSSAGQMADEHRGTAPSKFADIHDWHGLGTGRLACPGRFYAATVMKLMLAHLLTNYDMDLIDKAAPRSFSWRSSLIPRATTLVGFRERAVAAE